MSKILKLALNDLRLTVRDRGSAIWMLIFPVFLMWIFGNVFGGGTGPARISLGVLDRDGDWLARAVIAELEDEAVEIVELERGWVHGEDPEAPQPPRWLVIPEGFTTAVLAGEQRALRLEKDPDANEQYSMTAQVHLVRAIARLLARLVEIDSSAQDEAGIEPTSGEIAERFAGLSGREPQVRLEVSTAGSGQPVPSGFFQSVPGILTMTVLMMTVIYGAVFLTVEKEAGMLRRQAALPLGRAQIVVGKLAGRFLIAGVQIVVLLLVGRFAFGVSLGASPAGLALVLVSYAASVSGLATLLGAVLRTPEQAGALGWIVSMGMAALGGCWWPSEVMPRWIWQAAHALPTAWAMDAFHALISFGRGLEAALLPSAALLGFAVLYSVVGARLLRLS